MKEKKISGRGGARPGAGRKPKWGAKATHVSVCIPADAVVFFQACAAEKSHSLSAELAERLVRSYRASRPKS